MTGMTVQQRIERIFTEVKGCWAFRGVTSWDVDRLFDWREDSENLTPQELVILGNIERQVFGE